ncbi:glutamyl-tRNA reductase [Actinocrinis sp.]|uniref:glutamyl-tRNA reductase n=1 Tax=Actinocrinis sp. TaxID=1920516 RepID=UPI002D6FB4AA|nr:glutamyl-tRNA reductase [Actinocrinis sp.]HZP54387.1 glutamyl-tRNA reductase [Actinocrinis sp.]
MSLLVVGLSHRTAPIPLLEKAALPAERVAKLIGDAVGTEHVTEAIAVATCNRLEIYADVTRFHGALADLSDLVSLHSGIPVEELTEHLYVHYDNRAVQHLFNVACGLDSMVVGEPQILGQLRSALAAGQAEGTAGRVVNDLTQTALRVGKRAHSETGLDRAGQSLVTAALDLAVPLLEGARPAKAVVVGAGSMSSLAATTLSRLFPDLDLTVVNRTPDRAGRLAETVGARALGLDRLTESLAGADLVISCTGAVDTVISPADFGPAGDAAATPGGTRPRVVVDLALPRDVAPEVGALPGVTLIDLERIADAERDGAARVEAGSVEAVRRIVAEEVVAYAAAQRAATVGPTVTALRGMAADVVEAELARFDGRLPELDAKARAEVANTVRRVVDKLLHEPTVRVKQLASDPGGTSYAVALRELFNLDPAAPAAVSRAEPVLADEAAEPGDADPAREEGTV